MSYPTLRTGARKDGDNYSIQITRQEGVYEIALLTIEDLIAIRDHFDFLINLHMGNDQAHLFGQRTNSPRPI
jgi:hypothetical protein